MEAFVPAPQGTCLFLTCRLVKVSPPSAELLSHQPPNHVPSWPTGPCCPMGPWSPRNPGTADTPPLPWGPALPGAPRKPVKHQVSECSCAQQRVSSQRGQRWVQSKGWGPFLGVRSGGGGHRGPAQSPTWISWRALGPHFSLCTRKASPALGTHGPRLGGDLLGDAWNAWRSHGARSACRVKSSHECGEQGTSPAREWGTFQRGTTHLGILGLLWVLWVPCHPRSQRVQCCP